MKLLIITQKVDRKDDVLGFFHAWIEHFVKECDKVTVVTLWEGEHDLSANVLSIGKDEGKSKFAQLIAFYKYIIRERNNYDVVFVHMTPIFVIWGAPVWIILRKPMTLWYTHKSVDLKLRIAHFFVSKVFSASPESFRLPSKKVEIVGHGIDTTVLTPTVRNNREFSIITIGRLSPIKKVETIIQAVEALSKEGISARLDIVGKAAYKEEEPYVEELKAYVRDNNLESVIRFHGSVPNTDIQTYLSRADVFVNTSQTGSLDKAGLEAMSCGLALVTSNEGFSGVIGEYKDLLMFSHGDVEALIGTLKLIQESGMSEEIGRSLREEVVKNHSLDSLVPRLVESMNVLV